MAPAAQAATSNTLCYQAFVETLATASTDLIANQHLPGLLGTA
jgi:hypothetical protein